MISPSAKAPADGGGASFSGAFANTPKGWTRDTDAVEIAWLRGNDAKESYRVLLDAMDQAFCVIEMLFDHEGKPNDYRFLEINARFEE